MFPPSDCGKDYMIRWAGEDLTFWLHQNDDIENNTIVAKIRLKKHIKQVCQVVFNSSQSCQILIYDENDLNSEQTSEMDRTHEFLIIVQLAEDITQYNLFLEKIRNFTGKNVLMKITEKRCFFYWGEGKTLVTKDSLANDRATNKTQPRTMQKDSIENTTWLKTETVLPAWLDKELFDVHHARYDPDWQKFQHNLDLTEDDLRVYLGTYFPRSYVEAFCIIDNLFQNINYHQTWNGKNDVNILDIGCGCGGNLIGLLTCIEKYLHSVKRINITVIDGNQLALNVLETLINAFATRTTKHIDFTPVHKKIKTVKDLPDFNPPQFDFIASFKMGCEIISKGEGLCDNTYYELLSKYANTLSKTGLFLLLDITTKTNTGGYYPQLMNRQVNEFNRNNTGHTTLVPIPCHLYEAECMENCFTQKEFRVSHQEVSSDHSKVAYRIIGRNEFVQKIHTAHLATDYLICKKEAVNELCICPYSEGSERIMDAYKIDI